MKKTLVINFFGAPGAGKSTGAAYVFSLLKARGVNAELISEFAKQKVWEGNDTALGNQLYVFGKQQYAMARCRDQVDVIVTDAPLMNSVYYNSDPTLGKEFNTLVRKVSDTEGTRAIRGPLGRDAQGNRGLAAQQGAHGSVAHRRRRGKLSPTGLRRHDDARYA